MNQKNIAIILAAGRGSRMLNLTAAKPKCLLELAGKPLLLWQLAALNQAGIQDIVVVRGYQAQMLQSGVLGQFLTVDNPKWQSSNMVRSLLCALQYLKEAQIDFKELVISYADIVYKSEHIQKLLASSADFAITYDTLWQELWTLRQGNPLEDAETFKSENGKLLEIGNKPKDLSEIQGQYMGLLKFSFTAIRIIQDYLGTLSSDLVDKLDMTSFLQHLLAKKLEICTVPIAGGWCESDTENDIRLYESKLQQGHWTHDWR